MTGRTKRTGRQNKPAIESLESRRLLTAHAYDTKGNPIPDKNILHYFTQLANDVPLADRRMSYTTPAGTKVELTLYGIGSLKGTTVSSDGSLNLVYKGTNTSTAIIANTSGGTGQAPLASIRDAAVAPRSATATGSEAVNIVNLQNFNLIDGGYINLEGGVGQLNLASMAPNSQIHITGVTPVTYGNSASTSSVNSSLSSSFPSASGVTTTAPTLTGGIATTGVSTTTSNIPGGTQGSVTGTQAAGSSVTSTGTATPLLSATTTSGSTTTTTGATATGTSATSVGAGGSTSVGAGSVGSVLGGTGTTATVTPGAVLDIGDINGAPRTTPLGHPEIFGYDPVTATLDRFDATTGSLLQTIPVPQLGASMAGVGLGRDNGTLVALVGSGTTIVAYNAVTGAFVGAFSTTSLASLGLTTINGIGSNDANTFVSDSTADTFGLIEQIDVTASLASGNAVAITTPFAPTRQFQLAGDLTGLAGTDTIYATGAASFDQFQPGQTQLGILGVTQTGGKPLAETSRVAIQTSSGQTIDVGTPGQPLGNLTYALGSVSPYLVLGSSVVDGKYVVRLLNPSTLATVKSLDLQVGDLLTGLSESFHPELLNAALIDVSGNVRNLVSDQVTGLALTATGSIGLLKIRTAADSFVVGEPINHVAIGRRNNVVLKSTKRGPRGNSKRNGVEVVASLTPVGSLTLP